MKFLLSMFLIFGLVLSPTAALAQTVEGDNNNQTTNTDNSQDNDQDNDNTEVVVVVCTTTNVINDSANNGDQDADTDQDGDNTSTNTNTQGDTGTADDQEATQTITQETTVEQLPSVVAEFEQRGCDVTINYKSPTTNNPAVQPTPIVVTNTNTVERVIERASTNGTTTNGTTVNRAVRTVNTPSFAPATGGN